MKKSYTYKRLCVHVGTKFGLTRPGKALTLDFMQTLSDTTKGEEGGPTRMSKKETGGKVKGRTVTLWPKWVRLAFRIVARSVNKKTIEEVTGKQMADALKVPDATTADIKWTQYRAAALRGQPGTMREDYVTIAVDRLMRLDIDKHERSYYHPDRYSPNAIQPPEEPESAQPTGGAPPQGSSPSSPRTPDTDEPTTDDVFAWHATAVRRAAAKGKSELLAGYLDRLRGMDESSQLAFLKDFVRSLS